MLEGSTARISKLLAKQRVVSQIWNRDSRLRIGAPWLLDWLDPPLYATRGQGMEPYSIQSLITFAKDARKTFKDVVVIGMGGSVMSAKAFLCAFPYSAGSPFIHTVDSTHSENLSDLASRLDVQKTLFLVVTKSGTTVETLAIENFFREVGRGRSSPKNFAAVTEAVSPISLKRKEDFSVIFPFPKGVEGRYSALSAAGILPLMMQRGDAPSQAFTNAVDSMRVKCKLETITENPAMELGATLAAAVVENRRNLTINCSKKLRGFGLWLEQLLAESLGKDGTGIIPIVGEPDMPLDAYSTDRTFITISAEDDDEKLSNTIANSNTITNHLPEPDFIGAEMFKWQFATVLAGVALGVNPLDQPDVSSAKEHTSKILSSPKTPALNPVQFKEALSTVVSECCRYIALVGWLPESPEIGSAIAKLRYAITVKTKLPTVWGYAPAYLHSTGQLFKGGPKEVGLIALAKKSVVDPLIPNLGKTFGDMAHAQMIGDITAMKERGRVAVWSEIEEDYSNSILKLADDLLSDLA